MPANIRKGCWLSVLLLGAALSGCDKHAAPVAQAPSPEPSVERESAKTTPRPPEPTEAEIRELVAAGIDATNRQGGIVLVVTATGKRSEPIKVRLDGYQKTKCSPYTRAWRCEGQLSLSYPGSDLPPETLRHSRRFQKDAAGRWTMD